MIHSKRFFGKRLKRALLSANRTFYSYNLSIDRDPIECAHCLGSGTSEHNPLETCHSCNGSGIDSFIEQSDVDPLSIEQHMPMIENLINDFDEVALLINRRYSNVVALYRDW